MSESYEVMRTVTGAKDVQSGFFGTVSNDQSYVNRGRAFTSAIMSTGVAANAAVYVQFNTPSTGYVHLNEIGLTSIDTLSRLTILEATTNSTFTTGNTALSVWNKNRTSTDAPLASLFSNPTNVNSTNSSMINILKTIILGSSGTAAGGGRGADSDFFDIEWILKQNSTYIFELKNIGASAGQLGMDLFWYRAQTT
jgi:hypothetical protein